MRRVGLKLGLLALTVLLGAGVVVAQETTGGIWGVVTSSDGAALPGVTVQVERQETGLSYTRITDAEGNYRFASLPLGSYTLTASLEGFQTHRQNFQINLGQMPELTFQMGLGAMTDVIEVTGEVPLVDVRSTTIGVTVNSDELAGRMPLQRDANQIALLAPATLQGDTAFNENTPGQQLVAIGGASVAENSYQVNGLNITNFRNMLGSSLVPFEFMEEVQVKTGGYEAEFGRSTGGVINMVTKSGTNAFHGSANAFFEPESLQEQEPDTYLAFNQSEEREQLEANASLGGPILPDRAFFFAFARYTDRERLLIGETRATRELWDEPYWGGKLDLNLTSSHRLEGTFFTDEATVEETDYDFFGDTLSLGDEVGQAFLERGGDNWIGKYTGIFTDSFLLSGQFGKNEFARTDASSGDDCPLIIDARGDSAIYLGCFVTTLPAEASDEREAWRLDADVYVGDHSFRGGIDAEENLSIDSSFYSGHVYYRYVKAGDLFADQGIDPDTDLVRVRHYETGGSFTTESNAAYIQDTWTVTPRLTLNLGVRYEEFDNQNARGESFIAIDDQYAPRVGVIWDPTGRGTSKVFASYGTYHLPIAANTNIRMAGLEFFDEAYHILEGGINPDGTPVGIGQQLDYTLISDGEIPDPREAISSNIEPMSQDELILGYERMVGDNWSVGVRGVAREFGEVIEDFTLDAALAEIGVGVGAYAYRLGNPGADFIGWYDLDGDHVLDPITFTADQLNYPAAERKYYAVELTAQRRFADHFMLQGSYTWSHLYGNYEGYVNSEIGQDDAGITQSFDFAGLMDYAYGNLPQDRRHNLKLFGAYVWDSGLQLGGNVYFNSGRPVNSLTVHPTDPFAADYGAFSFFNPDGSPAPRGSIGTTDDIWGMDAMAKYNFKLQGLDLAVRMDVFNIFDNDGVTEVNELAEQDTGDIDTNWLEPTHYQNPRRVRFGIELTF